jgi:hypothetical protein
VGLGALGAPGAPPPELVAHPAVKSVAPNSDASIAAGSSRACAREGAAFIAWCLYWRPARHAPRLRTIHLR